MLFQSFYFHKSNLSDYFFNIIKHVNPNSKTIAFLYNRLKSIFYSFSNLIIFLKKKLKTKSSKLKSAANSFQSLSIGGRHLDRQIVRFLAIFSYRNLTLKSNIRNDYLSTDDINSFRSRVIRRALSTWIWLYQYSNSKSVDFKIEEAMSSFLNGWYPFNHGFFFVKTTKSNDFFFFGVMKQNLNFITYLHSIAYRSFDEDNSFDTYSFTEYLSRVDNRSFRIDYFMSAGSFGFFKKEKKSPSIIKIIQEYIHFYFIGYIITYKIDFFFLYLKGSFKNIKSIYYTFKKILKETFYSFRKERRSYRKKIKLLSSLLRKHAIRYKCTNLASISNLRKCLSSVYFFSRYLKHQIPQNTCLLGNVVTSEILLVDDVDIHNYFKYPYIFLVKNLTTRPNSIYFKRFSNKLIKFMSKFNLVKYLKQIFWNKKFGTKKTNTLINNHQSNKQSFKPNVKDRYYGSKPSGSKPSGSKPSGSISSGSATKDNTRILKLIEIMGFSAPEKVNTNPKNSTSVPNTNVNVSNKNNAEHKIVRTTSKLTSSIKKKLKSIKLKSKVVKSSVPWKLQRIWEFYYFYKKYKLKSVYRYITYSRSVKVHDLVKCLLSYNRMPNIFMKLLIKIVQLNYELRMAFLTLPRSFSVVDITSYPFNGCRRTRHYHKHSTI